MKINVGERLRRLLYNKKFTITASIVAAFIFWLAISALETPTIEQTLSGIPVTIETQDTIVGELGLDEVSGITDRTVSVRVSGPAYIISQLSQEDITVKASISDVTTPGQYELLLVSSKKTNGAEYSVLSITPSTISAVFDYMDTKQLTVEPIVTGISAVSGLVRDDPVISESGGNIITVKGPRTEMQKIARVEARIHGNEVLSATKSYNAQIYLLDAEGRELDHSKYTLSTSSVKVSVPIYKEKTVPVRAVFSNAPKDYANVGIAHYLSLSQIEIRGPEDTVNQIEYIELSPIDFYTISRSKNSFDMSLVLPDGVKTAGNIEFITVKIDTSGLSERNFTVNEVIADNSANYGVTLNSSIKNVKICGPRSVVNNLNPADLYAYVDVSGKSSGDYNVSVIIRSKSVTNIWQVGSYEATIRIE